MNFTERHKVLIETCVRITYCNLLHEDERDVSTFTGTLHNLNIGSFGRKGYSFDDTTDWTSCLKDLLEILAILDPDYHEHVAEVSRAALLEEK